MVTVHQAAGPQRPLDVPSVPSSPPPLRLHLGLHLLPDIPARLDDTPKGSGTSASTPGGTTWPGAQSSHAHSIQTGGNRLLICSAMAGWWVVGLIQAPSFTPPPPMPPECHAREGEEGAGAPCPGRVRTEMSAGELGW